MSTRIRRTRDGTQEMLRLERERRAAKNPRGFIPGIPKFTFTFLANLSDKKFFTTEGVRHKLLQDGIHNISEEQVEQAARELEEEGWVEFEEEK